MVTLETDNMNASYVNLGLLVFNDLRRNAFIALEPSCHGISELFDDEVEILVAINERVVEVEK
ncbi:hypothetical protein D3C84_986550 [compost metagenome]